MMTLDRLVAAPRSATRVALILLAPVLLMIFLMHLPGRGIGAAIVVFATAAIALYVYWAIVLFSRLTTSLAHRKALQLLRPTVDASSEPMWVCDQDGVVLLQNSAADLRHRNITGQNISAFLSRIRADASGTFYTLRQQAARSGCAELELTDSSILSLKLEGDVPLQLWSQLRVDTNARAVRADLIFSADEELIETIPVGLLQLRPDGSIIRANASARELLGNALSMIGGDTAQIDTALIRLDSAVAGWFGQFFEGQSSTRTELLAVKDQDNSTQKRAMLYLQLTLIRDQSDRNRLIGVVTDVTEMKSLEAQFAQSQKMQAIGQLAGGVAHDFNNLLTAIIGHCDLLMLRHGLDDPNFADLEQINQNANRAAALVGQLLSFSRKQNLQLELISLRDILADLTHLLNRLVGDRITLKIHHDPELKSIRADKRLLEQVIMNLVVNARDAMPEGGEIEISTANQTLREKTVRDKVSVPPGEYVCISVRDGGTGIAPEYIDKVFEPFFSTKAVGEGTGLGLSTVYGIVRQTGGYIDLTSETGKGTVFDIYFQALSPEVTSRPKPVEAVMAPKPAAAERSLTVLLVEDEASVRTFAARALRLKGHQVLEAGSAHEALELLNDDAVRPDLFITDVVMPDMDGPTWVRQALDTRPGTKVIFMSGYSEDVFIEDYVPIDSATFLAKPFTLAEFTGAVDERMRESA